jgi:hypothetical protein
MANSRLESAYLELYEDLAFELIRRAQKHVHAPEDIAVVVRSQAARMPVLEALRTKAEELLGDRLKIGDPSGQPRHCEMWGTRLYFVSVGEQVCGMRYDHAFIASLPDEATLACQWLNECFQLRLKTDDPPR